MSSSPVRLPPMALLSLVICCLMAVSEGDFVQDVDITFGDGRAKILEGGQLLTLTLDKASGSGFKSKKEYIFARFDVQMKLVPGNSAGTVTTFYLTSPEGPKHDEVDFEFLGNTTGDPYTLHTNVFAQGQGKREQGFNLWFDPTKEFHNYSIVWNPERIMFLVDGQPIRVHENLEKLGVPFPTRQPMRLYASLWDAEQWATKGGKEKTDWTKAPFVASYRNLRIKPYAGEKIGLDATERAHLQMVQQKYMIYNYCNHFPNDIECKQGGGNMMPQDPILQGGPGQARGPGQPGGPGQVRVPTPTGGPGQVRVPIPPGGPGQPAGPGQVRVPIPPGGTGQAPNVTD